MLKQSPSRSQRAKGFKVKHALQICLLLAICIWFLYQVNCSRDKKAAFVDSFIEILGKTQDNGHKIVIKLGRRSLHPRMEDGSSLEIDNHGANEDELQDEVVEEVKPEEETEAIGREEDVDVLDQERVEEEEQEEVEDLIDEDREREEVNGEQDTEESDQYDLDDLHSSEEIQNECISDSRKVIREQVKGGGGSSTIVMQNSGTLSRSLREVREHEIEMVEINANDKHDHIIGGMKDSDPKMKMRLKAKSNVEGKEKGSEFGLA